MTAFVYSENTAANWAAALAKFTSNIPDFLKEEENKTQDKVDWEILDTMLQDHLLLTHQVFEQIGHLHSFDFAVSDAMGSTRRFADFYSRVNLDAASHENEPDGVKDESKEGEEEELVALPPLPKNSNLDQLPFHSNFLFQRLAGLSAWGTSARLLAENKAFRVSTHLDLRIVELPRQAVVRHEWPAMVKHWGKIGRRKTTEVQQLPDLLPKLADSVTPTNEYGTVHCEAGIMASMLNGRAQEPSTVHSAFDTLRREYTVIYSVMFSGFLLALIRPNLEITIGVAKKSCPACSLLAETINMSPTANITVEVPGRHANWVPWVPPHWLPRDILEAMEIRLINVVLGLLKRHYDLTASNASSPISEEEVAPPVHPRLSKADERLRQLQQTSDEKEKKRREAEEKKRREDEGKKF
ncbi:hypothetical protein FB45DRAFT_1133888 [Roridomyces roridus]|uniref:Uncharacterized protein n=1 Tax=Roridomyces roridus TaxID=1738132 RepID=A0AAD7FRR4_9AGAR|nr:hypothetical protein FB45DRAFT_1133888 [Roridomyces roridus]